MGWFAFLEGRLAGLDNGLIGDGESGEVGLGQGARVVAVPHQEVGDKALLREGALASNVVHRCLLFKHSNRNIQTAPLPSSAPSCSNFLSTSLAFFLPSALMSPL